MTDGKDTAAKTKPLTSKRNAQNRPETIHRGSGFGRFCVSGANRQLGSDTLCVFESTIDALSYLTLLKQRGKDWRKANTLSLGGVGKEDRQLPPALSRYLKAAPHITRIVLCLDNDAPGRKAAAVLKELLRGYEVIDRPPVRGKDYNDLLRYRRDAQRGEAR